MYRTPFTNNYVSKGFSSTFLLIVTFVLLSLRGDRRRATWQSIIILIAFTFNSIGSVPLAQAQEFHLPPPGVMVALSPKFTPVVLKGIQLDPQNPFRFHFYIDTGNSLPLRGEGAGGGDQEQLKTESTKLIKYFLASLTIPEKDLWVNLSPYEKDRIVPEEFGQTEMGRDLLAEDYILKQITASLIYPESQLGKEFWNKVYAQAQAKYGTTNIPINTFNKVWIVPDKAVVYENNGVAFVLENHLKVMLEQDYLSLQKHSVILSAAKDLNKINSIIDSSATPQNDVNSLGSQIVRDLVIPQLDREVNEGKNFSQLRQVFYSLILATWYKKKIKDSILNKIYSDRNKIIGVQYDKSVILSAAKDLNKINSIRDSSAAPQNDDIERIYQQYLKAFKKGVFNYIIEESSSFPPPGREGQGGGRIPRKYFSGGVAAYDMDHSIFAIGPQEIDKAQVSALDQAQLVDAMVDMSMINKNPPSADMALDALLKISLNTLENTALILAHCIRIRDLLATDDQWAKNYGLKLLLKAAESKIITKEMMDHFKFIESSIKILKTDFYKINKLIAAQVLDRYLADYSVDIGQEGEAALWQGLGDENGELIKLVCASALIKLIDKDPSITPRLVPKVVRFANEMNSIFAFTNSIVLLKNLVKKKIDVGPEGIEFLILAASTNPMDIVDMISKKNPSLLPLENDEMHSGWRIAFGEDIKDGREVLENILKIPDYPIDDALRERIKQSIRESLLIHDIEPSQHIPEPIDVTGLLNATEDNPAPIKTEEGSRLAEAILKGSEAYRKESMQKLLLALDASNPLRVISRALEIIGNLNNYELIRGNMEERIKLILSEGNQDLRPMAIYALKSVFVKEIQSQKDVLIPALTALLEHGSDASQIYVIDALTEAVRSHPELDEEIRPHMMTILTGSANSIIKSQALGYIKMLLDRDLPIDQSVIRPLLQLEDDRIYGDGVPSMIKRIVEKTGIPTISLEEMREFSDLLLFEVKNPSRANDELKARFAGLLYIDSIYRKKIYKEAVVYLGKAIDETDNLEMTEYMLSIMLDWSNNGSAEAQNYLESKINNIIARRPDDGGFEPAHEFIKISPKDELFIDTVAKSFREIALIPLFVKKNMLFRIRVKVMKLLAKDGYIDSAYDLISGNERLASILKLVSDVYDQMGITAPLMLIDKLLLGEEDIEELKKLKPEIEAVIARHDHKFLIEYLLGDHRRELAYYLLFQSPFQYQGTHTLSFERFHQLLTDTHQKLKMENKDIVLITLKEAYIKAGLDEHSAQEIVEAVLQGRPPLPKDSPYLDHNGNFIPQKVDFLKNFDRNADMQGIKSSFESSLKHIGLILKNYSLFSQIQEIIKTDKFRADSNPDKDRVLAAWVDINLSLGASPNLINKKLVNINDILFPPQRRVRSLDSNLAAKINKQIRQMPTFLKVMNEETRNVSPETILLESIDIEQIVRNREILINSLKDKQTKGRLTPIEKSIIGDQPIDIKHVLRIALADLLVKLRFQNQGPLYNSFKDAEGHLLEALENYIKFISQGLDLNDLPPVMYVDFISKFNLFEFFRFADGGHCCLTSDPKIADQWNGFQTYSQEMPRYLANATSFWWQFTTQPRGGRQVGWFENWLGLNSQGQVFVGTELMYISPSFRNIGLQKALLGEVEKVLFSTQVTSIAQALPEHRPSNAMEPTEDYKPEEIKITKLQSLNDWAVDLSRFDGIDFSKAPTLDPKNAESIWIPLEGDPTKFRLRQGVKIIQRGLENMDVADYHKFMEIWHEAVAGIAMYEDTTLKGNTELSHAFYVKYNSQNVSMEFVNSTDVTGSLIDKLLNIEDQVFPENKSMGREYMESHLRNSKGIILILRDSVTNEIVGYSHSVPATEAWFIPNKSNYDEYRTDQVLYMSDIALLPQYWGKADMGNKLRLLAKEAKRRGFKFIALHTESTNGVRPGESLSQKLQKMGYEVKFEEPNWQGSEEEYDFLVLDLNKVDLAMMTTEEAKNHQAIEQIMLQLTYKYALVMKEGRRLKIGFFQNDPIFLAIRRIHRLCVQLERGKLQAHDYQTIEDLLDQINTALLYLTFPYSKHEINLASNYLHELEVEDKGNRLAIEREARPVATYLFGNRFKINTILRFFMRRDGLIKMVRRSLIFEDKAGMHGRPSAQIAAVARAMKEKLGIDLYVHDGEENQDTPAVYILGLLSLRANNGDPIDFLAEGDAKISEKTLEEALNIMQRLLKDERHLEGIEYNSLYSRQISELAESLNKEKLAVHSPITDPNEIFMLPGVRVISPTLLESFDRNQPEWFNPAEKRVLAIERHFHMFPLHGNIVIDHQANQVILIVGRPGAGKSNITYRLIKSSRFSISGDDSVIAYFDDNGGLHASGFAYRTAQRRNKRGLLRIYAQETDLRFGFLPVAAIVNLILDGNAPNFNIDTGRLNGRFNNPNNNVIVDAGNEEKIRKSRIFGFNVIISRSNRNYDAVTAAIKKELSDHMMKIKTIHSRVQIVTLRGSTNLNPGLISTTLSKDYHKDKMMHSEAANWLPHSYAALTSEADKMSWIHARLQQKPWVLLVEDEEEQLRKYIGHMQRSGFKGTIIVARNYKEALSKFQELRNHLGMIITDLQMPMDKEEGDPLPLGFYLRERLHQEDSTMPIILQSSAFKGENLFYELVWYKGSFESNWDQIVKDLGMVSKFTRHEGGINLNPASMSLEIRKANGDKAGITSQRMLPMTPDFFIDPNQVLGAQFKTCSMTRVKNILPILGLNLALVKNSGH